MKHSHILPLAFCIFFLTLVILVQARHHSHHAKHKHSHPHKSSKTPKPAPPPSPPHNQNYNNASGIFDLRKFGAIGDGETDDTESSRDSESDDMRGYLMVIRTFRPPRRTSSMVSGWCWLSDSDYFLKFLQVFTFVIQRRRIRWHAGVPYGYPHLSSTKVNEFDGIGMMWSSGSDYFWKFLQVLLSSSRDIQARWRTRFFSARQGRSSPIACSD